MAALALAAATLAGLSTYFGSGPAGAQAGGPDAAPGRVRDLQAGLAIKLRLTRADGAPIDRPEPGAAFRIAFELGDVATGAPAAGLHPAVWLRPREATNASCDEAGRAWRATGRLPLGAIDLNGVIIATLDDDDRLAFVDPRLDLATSNMLSVGHAKGPWLELAADRDGQRVLLRGVEGVRARRADGAEESLTPPGRPRSRILALPSAGLWTASDGVLARIDAAQGQGPAEIALGGPISILRDARPAGGRPARQDVAAQPELFAATSAGSAVLVHADGAEERIALGPVRDAVFAPTAAAMLALGQDRRLSFVGLAGGSQTSVALPAEADRLELAPGERLAVAWSPANSALSFVEVSTMRLAGALSFNRPVREIAFAGGYAFALLDDLSSVIAIDLGSVTPGSAPKLHSIPLGPSTIVPPGSGPYLATLAPQPRVMALHRPTQTVFIVSADGGERMPPMTAFRLKGGAPRAILTLDRSLLETSPGRYTTSAIGPQAGPWEVVLTTGTGGLTTCFTIDVGDGKLARNDDRIRVAVTVDPVRLPRSGGSGEAELSIHVDAGAHGAALADRLPFSVMALDRPWRAEVTAERMEAGRYRARLRLPGPGQYPIVPAFALPRLSEAKPGLIQVELSSE